MAAINKTDYCTWVNHIGIYETHTVEEALNLENDAKKLKGDFWQMLDKHFLKGNADFQSIQARLLEFHENRLKPHLGIEDKDSEIRLKPITATWQKILDISDNPDELRPYNTSLKILKIISIAGAILFLLAAVLAFVQLEYNALNIPFSYLHLGIIGFAIFSLTFLIRSCCKCQASKTELPEAYDQLWKPIFDFIFDLPKPIENAAATTRIERDFQKNHHESVQLGQAVFLESSHES